MLAASIILATALVANHIVDVRSPSACPSAQAIAERLAPLLPASAPAGNEPDLATVELIHTHEGGAQLQVRLVRASGTEVGNRRIDVVPGQCSEAAATVAAMIAAWETEPAASAPIGALTRAPAKPIIAAVAPAPRSWRLSLGAGGGAGFVGGVAGIGKIEMLAGTESGRWRGRVGFSGETLRTSSLSTGKVDWRHTLFEVGVLWRTLGPRWSLSFDAGLTFGWATLQGRGFSPDSERRSFESGATAAVRLGRSLGGWSAWAEVRAYGWVTAQHASLAGDEAGLDLPRVDVAASLGLSTPFF
jgi:hypothetical protein